MNSRALNWGKSCNSFSTYIVGGVLDSYIMWNHFSIGIGNYIYPKMKTSEIEKIKEKYQDVLFHGSKYGLSEVTISGSRDNDDFGKGFYLGETYNQALSFVCEKEKSCV